MANTTNRNDQREAGYILGEMAATRLFSLLHERMEELSVKYGIKQSDVAERLGVTEQQVSHWLLQPRNMTVRSAGRLLGAMDAHLQFDLDKFENMRQGNAAAAMPTITVGTVSKVTSDGMTRELPTQVVGQISRSESTKVLCG